MITHKPFFGATAMAAASALRVAIQVAILPIIGRLLGPHAYGQIALVSPFIIFAMLLAESGLGACIVRANEVTKELRGTVFCFSAALSLVVIAIFAALAYPLGSLLHEPLFPALLMGMSCTLLFAALTIVPAAILVRTKHYDWIALSDVVSTFGGVAAVTLGIFMGWGVWSLVVQQIVFWVCKVSVVTFGSRSWPRFIFRWRIIKENIQFGSNITAASALSFISRNVDNILIGTFMGAESLGYYALAYQITSLPSMVLSGSIYFTVFSATSEAKRLGNHTPTYSLKMLRGVLLIAAPTMVGIAATAQLSIPLLLGDKWLPSIPILICLLPLGITQAMGAPIGGVLIGMGRADLSLRLNLVSSTATILAICIGVAFNSIAVAAGISLAAIVSCANVLRVYMRECKVSLKEIATSLKAPLTAALLMGCTVVIIQTTVFVELHLIARLLISILTGIAVYSAILFGLFHDHVSEDIKTIKVALSSRLASRRQLS